MLCDRWPCNTVVVVITFMQGFYNYIPETNHVSGVYSTAAVLQIQLMGHVMLFPMMNVLYCCISTFQVCVQCLMWLFSVLNFLLLWCVLGIFWILISHFQSLQINQTNWVRYSWFLIVLSGRHPVWFLVGAPAVLTEVSCGFFSPSRKMAGQCLKWSNNHFLPHPFQFIIDKPIYHSVLHSHCKVNT